MAHCTLPRPDPIWSHDLSQEPHIKRDIDKLEYVQQRVTMSHENLLEDTMRCLPRK